MSTRTSHGSMFPGRRGRVASLIVAGPVVLGSAALAQDSSTPGHLSETSIPRGIAVGPIEPAVAEPFGPASPKIVPVSAEDERGGVFSWFRRDRSDDDDRPSLFDRMRGRDREPAPAASEPRQGLMGRLMSPFREGESREGERGGDGETGSLRAGESEEFAQEHSATITPPPAPAPSALPSERTARLEDGDHYSGVGASDASGLVPLPDDDVFETLSPAGTEVVPDPMAFEEAKETPVVENGPPPAPAVNIPAPSEATRMVPDPFEEVSSLNTVPAPSVSERSLPEMTASAADPREDARYVAIARKLAERRGLVGLQGFCPVALRERHQLVDARPEFLCVHRGRTYEVSSAQAKARFDANPRRYAPAARGFDVVLMVRGEGRIEGTLTNSVWYDDRLYLFATPETASEFGTNPGRYAIEE